MANGDGTEPKIPVIVFGLGVGAAIFGLIYAVGVESHAISFIVEDDGGLPDAFWAALTSIAAMALLVERAVEVILNATGQNPEALYDAANDQMVEGPSQRPEAAMIGVVLGVIVSASGVLILDTLVSVTICTENPAPVGSDCITTFAWYLFRFADIALTAGVIGGGANGLHPFMDALTSFGGSMRDRARGVDVNADVPTVRDPQRHAELKAGGASTVARVAVPVAVTPVPGATPTPVPTPASPPAPAAPPVTSPPPDPGVAPEASASDAPKSGKS